MTQRIEAVIFDIGNVLVRWDPRFLYEKLIGCPGAREHFVTHVVSPEWHSGLDRGMRFADGIAALIARFPEHADLIRAYDGRWFETIPYEIPGTAALVERLSARNVPLYALTNFPSEKFPPFCARYPVMCHFRDVIVSGDEGAIKPEPEIYALAERRTGIAPDRLFFIDDRLENVEAAEKRGWHGHHFTDAEVLEAALTGQGLL